MYKYDDYVNLTNVLDLPVEIRNKCVRIVSVSENLEDIIIVHKFKLYVVNEKYIKGIME
ncbi:hypothetical protein [Clostridioides difficile]|uniref:hypothetical protein n=1 Tax=Clostridioides difficile TaxID=1496 RepID=UPI00103380CE|nr:hypothetical protein [Clostridioides difficile]